jgi:hypothetical protein
MMPNRRMAKTVPIGSAAVRILVPADGSRYAETESWQCIGSDFMKPDKSGLILPVLLIALGGGWLITSLGVGSGIDWIWTLGLASVGLLSFLISGLDKVTVVLGPLFLAASCLSFMRQAGHITLDVEIPILVMLAGVLMLVARMPAVPTPSWIIKDPDQRPSDTQGTT